MRITGGKWRGHTLSAPKSDAIRPTTDRARESLFNILVHGHAEHLEGARVLDVFAGTGALGLEALSRGGGFALFMETGVEGRGLLRRNVEALGAGGATKIFRRDATKPGAVTPLAPFGLVFADPPYGKALGERAAVALAAGGWLEPGALLVLEERAGAQPDAIGGFERIDIRKFGDTEIGFWTFGGG